MKTIHEKSILYYLLAIILGFSFLGVGLTEAFKNYFYSEKNQQLLNQAMKVSEIYSDSTNENGFDEEQFYRELMVLDKYTDYSYFMTDNDLNILIASKDMDITNSNRKINFEGRNNIFNGDAVYGSNDFGDIYPDSRYYIAYPIAINDINYGIVFVTTSLKSLHRNIAKAYTISGIFIIVAIIIGFVVFTISMSKTLSGITKLNQAAKLIANGNFEQKIEIKGNDELAQLANSFNDMADSLNKSEKNKQEFLSNIAHDIRSPLTSINGFLNALLDGTIPSEKAERYLKIIKSETDRLSKISNSILDLNKTAESRFAIMHINFNINNLLTNTIESMNSRIAEKNINILNNFFDKDINVLADYEKIQRVLYNLYDNAIKFVNENGSIITKVTKENNKALISITNTGNGLSEEECKRVFDRLYKADSSRGVDKTGSGLGLAIVKEFINAHGETITVQSELNKYTTFSFTLKLAE